MAKEKIPANRPAWLPWVLGLMFAAGLANLIYMFTGAYASYGNLYPAAVALLTVVMFAGLSGIWNMERWGLYVSLAACMGKGILDIIVHGYGPMDLFLLIPAILFIVLSKKMT
jgi:hypothetical protein